MALYYITGVAGTGKSTIREELLERGYVTHEGDDINAWQNKATREWVEAPANDSELPEEWYQDYDWNISPDNLSALTAEAKDTPVFVCGTAGNRYEVWDMFDAVISLKVDEATLKYRLATRTNHTFGKNPTELKAILGWHQTAEIEDEKAGALMVDTTAPLKDVVDEILQLLNVS